MLYLAKRAISDLQLGVIFPCTRVKYSDKDDFSKLTHFMIYIQSTIVIPLIIGIDDTNTLHWYVDAAYKAHRHIRSHTGLMITMGQEASSSKSTKHKFDTKSSTKSNIVGIDD